MSKQEEIKEAASIKVWSKLSAMMEITTDPNTYWKMDLERQLQLRERDLFEQEVWSYILELIEKDNKLRNKRHLKKLLKNVLSTLTTEIHL